MRRMSNVECRMSNVSPRVSRRVANGEYWVSSKVCGLLLGLISIFLTAGCEEDVLTVLGTDRPYSLYGVFSPQLDTQWVRVYPIDDILELESPEPLDARFTTEDMMSGETRVWRDTLLQEQNGQVAHAYWSAFAAEYGHDYRVIIERSDGASSSAQPAVPIFSELELLDPTIAPASHPVFVNAPVPHLFAIEVTYAVTYQLPGTPIITARFQLNYDGKANQREDGWVIFVNLGQDFVLIRNALIENVAFDPSSDITLQHMTLELVVASEDWDPPGGEFDPEVLVQPGLLSNVDNGFGFVGAGYRRDIRWTPPNEVIAAAGFTPPADDERPG